MKNKCYKSLQNEISKLRRFFEFLKEEKGFESFDESFFGEDRVDTMEDYFESLENSKMNHSSISVYGYTLASFFKFYMKRNTRVKEEEEMRINAERVIEKTTEESRKFSQNYRSARNMNEESLHKDSELNILVGEKVGQEKKEFEYQRKIDSVIGNFDCEVNLSDIFEIILFFTLKRENKLQRNTRMKNTMRQSCTVHSLTNFWKGRESASQRTQRRGLKTS